jgi:Na+-transporting methylmalonyl-CoA/oxaloacetate decarboxylase gamma subunit
MKIEKFFGVLATTIACISGAYMATHFPSISPWKVLGWVLVFFVLSILIPLLYTSFSYIPHFFKKKEEEKRKDKKTEVGDRWLCIKDQEVATILQVTSDGVAVKIERYPTGEIMRAELLLSHRAWYFYQKECSYMGKTK